MKKTVENAIYLKCEICVFKCSKQSNYDIHLLTAKHKNRTNLNNLEPIKNASKMFACKNCNKEYKARNSLWYHEQKCNYEKQKENINNDKDNINSDKNNIINDKDNLINLLLTQNKELMGLLKNGIVNNTTNNTNTNSHNTFNLNVFLNETCKDAMNIGDFVSSIKVNLEELENTGRQGYIEGISNIILKRLNNLEHTFRPLHCSDSKREVFYIKDNNEWKKETEEKPILTKAIKVIANENIKQIKHWRDKYPDCTDSDSKKNNLYLKIVSNSMNGLTQEESIKNIDKIISNVAKEVIINKANL
jgi:hypothetical protein